MDVTCRMCVQRGRCPESAHFGLSTMPEGVANGRGLLPARILWRSQCQNGWSTGSISCDGASEGVPNARMGGQRARFPAEVHLRVVPMPDWVVNGLDFMRWRI